jgi:Holliday junction resolvasome RuvABC endonuclease subunit
MNILSVDQSTNLSGFAVLDETQKLIDFGIIDLSKLPKQTDQEQAIKRSILLQRIDEIIDKYAVYQIITEGVYFHNNADTHRKLSQIQGCIQDYSIRKGLVCFSFKCAGEWRKWLQIKSKTRADYKAETKKYVLANFDVPDNLSEDIYDAISINAAYFKMVKKIE